MKNTHTIQELERIEKKGFELLGPAFRDTLAFIILQRQKKELLAKTEGGGK